MARRMAAVGRVTVSLRKSTTPSKPLTRSRSTMESFPLASDIAAGLSVKFNGAIPHFVRNAQFLWRQTNHPSFSLEEPRGRQPFNALAQGSAAAVFDVRQVNSRKLPQSKKNLLVQRLLFRDLFQLFRRKPARFNRACVRRGVVHISPPLCPGKRMRTRAKP